jgi:hypothetical protein
MRQVRDMRLPTLLVALVVLISPLSARSQTAATSPSDSPPAAAQPIATAPGLAAPGPAAPTAPVLVAKDIQGLNVFGTDGQQVGKIAKVNVSDGTVKDVEVQSAGFLGFFAKTYLLPAEKLSKKGGRVEVSMTREQARQFVK